MVIFSEMINKELKSQLEREMCSFTYLNTTV